MQSSEGRLALLCSTGPIRKSFLHEQSHAYGLKIRLLWGKLKSVFVDQLAENGVFHHFRCRQSFRSVGCLASQLERIWANAIHNQRFVHYVSGGACCKTRFDGESTTSLEHNQTPGCIQSRGTAIRFSVPPFWQSERLCAFSFYDTLQIEFETKQ